MRPLPVASALAVAAARALAVESCELNGEHVNPANGSTTAGTSGLMRCRDGAGGPVVRGRIARERELDASGAVVHDDEVFEDGSRKAFER